MARPEMRCRCGAVLLAGDRLQIVIATIPERREEWWHETCRAAYLAALDPAATEGGEG